MVGKDDETRTSEATSSDPALDATIPASGSNGSGRRDSRTDERDGRTEAQPGELVGRYRIIEVLGRGGMGVVYRAKDPELDRELAIKLVHPSSRSRGAHDRLLAEARAMAKLRHPAVVPVFDVGTANGSVFIVMPLISGGTMYEWMREERPWPEVVDRFITAGRGLAVAHGAGLVHRDFKPRNVLVSDAGDVLVADFGIAAVTDASPTPTGASPTPGSAQVSSIAGTPAYMPPEQAEGSPVDARADQYSYCISFWEALCGERPTDAETRAKGPLAIATRNRSGKASRAPAWLLAAIARGFSAQPQERWPSLDALIRHIETRRRRPRRVAAAFGAIGLVALAAGVAMVARGGDEDPCPDPAARLSKIWSPSIRRELEAAVRAANVPYADEAFQRIAMRIDRFAGDWRGMHVAACRAGVVEHTQSSVLHDRRMMCLDRQLDVLRTKIEVLRGVDSATAQRAIDFAALLPQIKECDDATALLARVPSPTDPRARNQMIDLERRIRDLDVYAIRGAPSDAFEKAESLAAEARALGHAPTLVTALRALATIAEINRKPTEATLRELATSASSAKDDAAVTEAWSRLVYELARNQRFEEARALEPVAEAALTRAGSTPALVFRVNTSLGGRALFESDVTVAKQHFEKALAAAENPVALRTALNNMALATAQSGDMKAALQFIEKAIVAGEEAYGTRHPQIADMNVTLAQVLTQLGDPSLFPRADSALSKALEIRTTAFGENAVPVANTLTTMAMVSTIRGDYQKAEAQLRRAIAILEKDADPAQLAISVRQLGDTVSYQRGIEEARPIYERALALSEQVGGKKDIEYIAASLNFSTDIADVGDCATARAHAQNAIDVLGASGHPALSVAYQILGKCDLIDGRVDDGFRHLERALEVCEIGTCTTGMREDLQYSLGTRLFEQGRDKKRAIELVKSARTGLEAIGRTEGVAEIDTWLGKNSR